MMFCQKCGEAIPDDSEICPNCGVNLKSETEDQTVIYASQSSMDTLESKNDQDKKKAILKIPKLAQIGIAAIVVCLVIFCGVTEMEKANLKKELSGEWKYVYEEKIIKVLDFSDGQVEYRLETGYSWLDTTVTQGNYKVVGKNKIKMNITGDKYETYTIQFNDDKDVLTVTPAITNSDQEEVWYSLDK